MDLLVLSSQQVVFRGSLNMAFLGQHGWWTLIIKNCKAFIG